MTATAPAPDSFRRRFIDGELIVGTFIKTPTTHATEILGSLGFDFVVVDEEHAPFDRVATDMVLLAARAAGTAGLVRVPEPSAAAIQAVLDCGATGVLVPHVDSPAKAAAMVEACRYRGGKRGFSNSPRAGRYGQARMWDHVAASDAAVTAIAMIEDPPALDVIDAIVAVEGLDGVFIGRGDLTVALRASETGAAEVVEATGRIARAARSAGKAVAAMVGTIEEARWLRELGASCFIVASDQGFLRQAAARALADFKTLA
jgi:2-keto-3-deoxy-L-rhamnonate aldolase RhmA